MDISGIINLATRMAETRSNQEVGYAVLKKALDTNSAGALALLEAIPPTPSANLPAHLGQNINTTA